MAQEFLIRASAPGSLMLMGEHAVVQGHKSIVCAVDRRITVTIKPQSQRVVTISSTLGEYRGSLDSLPDHPALRFVLDAIRSKASQLPSGFSLQVESEFSHQIGFGSSSAVTVAVVAALQYWLRGELSHERVFEEALDVMLNVQGRGSGSDIAASVYGSVISYRRTPREITPLGGLLEIAIAYSGYKTPTTDVLAQVGQQQQYLPDRYVELYGLMGRTTQDAEAAIRSADWPQLGRIMNFYQGLMDALGVNDHKLSDIIYRLRGCEGVLGAKISGSGLGDCVIALGDADYGDLADQVQRIPISEQGVNAVYA